MFTQTAVPQSGFGRQLGAEPYVADIARVTANSELIDQLSEMT